MVFVVVLADVEMPTMMTMLVTFSGVLVLVVVVVVAVDADMTGNVVLMVGTVDVVVKVEDALGRALLTVVVEGAAVVVGAIVVKLIVLFRVTVEVLYVVVVVVVVSAIIIVNIGVVLLAT